MSDFKLPSDSQRSIVLGRTGSGKTLAATWQLSLRSFDKMPWTILDFKRDALLNKLGAKEVELKYIPKKPGLYIKHPLPDDQEEVEEYLWNIWKKEKQGLFFDEGYMATGLKSFRAILTQGRSKRIPCIILSQRPVWIDRFCFSEADHFQIFWLQDDRDRKTVQSFIPVDVNQRLPDYHSIWYNVNHDRVSVLQPVPNERQLISDFKARLGRHQRLL